MARPEYVVIGEVIKARGLRGEVVVRSLSDVEDRFETLPGAYVEAHDGDERGEGGGGGHIWYAVETVREHRGAYLIKFENVDDPAQARARLVGRALEIPAAESPPAGEDANYYYELIGLEVMLEDGMRLGEIVRIIETGANDVYVVHGAGGRETLIPGTREVVIAVDLEAGTMVIRPLPGLLELGEEE